MLYLLWSPSPTETPSSHHALCWPRRARHAAHADSAHKNVKGASGETKNPPATNTGMLWNSCWLRCAAPAPYSSRVSRNTTHAVAAASRKLGTRIAHGASPRGPVALATSSATAGGWSR